MELSELYPSKYLRGADLGGKYTLVTIARVEMESLYDAQQKMEVKKMVLYFTGKQKGWILSKASAYKVAEIVGSENTDTWKNHELVIFAERRLVYGAEKLVLSARAKAEVEA